MSLRRSWDTDRPAEDAADGPMQGGTNDGANTPKKILIVEDEAYIRLLIEQTLEELGRARRGDPQDRQRR